MGPRGAGVGDDRPAPQVLGVGFLPDVRRFGATYFNYVGKPLAYVLATPEQRRRRRQPAERGYGNEGNEADIHRFAERFACPLTDGFGSTESAVSVVRMENQPPGSIGKAADTITILDQDTGEECPRGRFDTDGKLLNGEEAIGEIVNLDPPNFEGYWNNEEANRERMRDGVVLERRPRLPRRRRLVLLRRTQRRLDPGRRRELRARRSSAS